ncbi:hypothetical protein [Rummeliibacillus suwonensis]|uniref:hypothetical protein n=1 Tax=Rummeliibacillus suwonensis TaxID=1306154 RepID=UPI001AAEFD4B|nr:hypothetical protein [Rummeliibacillus suwonensis]MBO2536546.1 hypothetical protein [Rummeliibacillus suwonensis]
MQNQDQTWDEFENIRIYKDRIRIFLILYIFSEEITGQKATLYKRVFKSEVKLQKIDFLLRNPDYFSYELLLFARDGKFDLDEVKTIVKEIFNTREPSIRRLEMERFFFGAYENIDDVISFLKSIDFIDYQSKRSTDLKKIDKHYYITQFAYDKFENSLRELPTIQWYINRCRLIKRYFGDLNGSQLKILQYQIAEYRNTSYKEYINDIQGEVKKIYFEMYGEEL